MEGQTLDPTMSWGVQHSTTHSCCSQNYYVSGMQQASQAYSMIRFEEIKTQQLARTCSFHYIIICKLAGFSFLRPYLLEGRNHNRQCSQAAKPRLPALQRLQQSIFSWLDILPTVKSIDCIISRQCKFCWPLRFCSACFVFS